MAGQRRKHSLPAGVLPDGPREGAEDGGSRDRAKAPAPLAESSRTTIRYMSAEFACKNKPRLASHAKNLRGLV